MSEPVSTPSATKPVAVKPAPVIAVTPWTYREKNTKESVLGKLKTFKPEGNPEPAQLESARAFAIAEVSALADCGGVEVIIEARSDAGSRQVTVIVLKLF